MQKSAGSFLFWGTRARSETGRAELASPTPANSPERVGVGAGRAGAVGELAELRATSQPTRGTTTRSPDRARSSSSIAFTGRRPLPQWDAERGDDPDGNPSCFRLSLFSFLGGLLLARRLRRLGIDSVRQILSLWCRYSLCVGEPTVWRCWIAQSSETVARRGGGRRVCQRRGSAAAPAPEGPSRGRPTNQPATANPST